MAITRDEADRLLATIGAVYDRLATAMYAVDSHPTLTYLRAAMYTGRTHQMREALLFDVGVMWAQFTTIGDILEQARALRAQFRPSDARWVDLDRLLAGPIVAVDNAGLPVTVSLAAGQRGGNPIGACVHRIRSVEPDRIARTRPDRWHGAGRRSSNGPPDPMRGREPTVGGDRPGRERRGGRGRRTSPRR